MPVKSFKFISPGIFINEVDNSQLPRVGTEMGPVIIGRTERGPAMRPVKVNSFSEFVEVFGNPIAGGQGGDIWRDGNYTTPTYASYAAQAYLRNSNSATVVRLLGADQDGLADGAAGKAGWQTTLDNNIATASNGGAYGLFVFDSGSHETTNNGALAAVWYLTEGSIALSGTVRGSADADVYANAATLVADNDSKFKAVILDDAGLVSKEVSFNFTPSSSKYIRKVFNTNPTLTNSDITQTDQIETYWLGQTYEGHIANTLSGGTTANTWGAVLGLDSSSYSAADFRTGFQAAQTPWIISQDMGAYANYQAEEMTKLFKFHTLDAGEEEQKKLKISIADIKASTSVDEPYGSFSVLIRDARDNDNAPVVLERYSSVNLNKNSNNYIGRAIGDQYLTWDDTERRHRVYGNYVNASKFIRVEVDSTIEAGGDAALLPFGSFGPVRMKSWTWHSSMSGTVPNNAWALGGGSIPSADVGRFINDGTSSHGGEFTGSVKYPAIPLRVSASAGGLSNPKNAYFGIDTTQNGNNRHDSSYADVVHMLPVAADSFATSVSTEFSYMFSLDDVEPSTGGSPNAIGQWVSGSRKGGLSWTAISGTYATILDQGYNRFTVPLCGGFDGLDITEKDPFNYTRALADGTDSTKYAYYSAKRAIDTVADPEAVEYNLMTMPGIYHAGLTSHMMEVCESRGDALAVIDLDSGYRTDAESTDAIADRVGSVSLAISNLTTRGVNSSYGCAYYPWVQINDSLSNSLLWAPPSIVALGTFSSSQRKSELWFAPAGFTRGGLTEGSAGIGVIQTRERLTSKNREANINPIASFPSEGIVIFGQKTLQVTPSALDRINVRRLMIYVKKEISRMAATVLFDQNVPATWNRFISKAEPFLRSVQARLGLSDFRIILDESTTTADLVDRNVMYAKIFLKPARSIEFIALDFVISSTGAGFED
jgi:phage tail sheath protein FI